MYSLLALGLVLVYKASGRLQLRARRVRHRRRLLAYVASDKSYWACRSASPSCSAWWLRSRRAGDRTARDPPAVRRAAGHAARRDGRRRAARHRHRVLAIQRPAIRSFPAISTRPTGSPCSGSGSPTSASSSCWCWPPWRWPRCVLPLAARARRAGCVAGTGRSRAGRGQRPTGVEPDVGPRRPARGAGGDSQLRPTAASVPSSPGSSLGAAPRSSPGSPPPSSAACQPAGRRRRRAHHRHRGGLRRPRGLRGGSRGPVGDRVRDAAAGAAHRPQGLFVRKAAGLMAMRRSRGASEDLTFRRRAGGSRTRRRCGPRSRWFVLCLPGNVLSPVDGPQPRGRRRHTSHRDLRDHRPLAQRAHRLRRADLARPPGLRRHRLVHVRLRRHRARPGVLDGARRRRAHRRAPGRLLLGAVALRVTGLYFALVTLSYGVMAKESLFNVESLTGGDAGQDAPRPIGFESHYRYYYLCLAFLALVLWLDWRMMRTKGGRALLALRENPRVAATLGINVRASRCWPSRSAVLRRHRRSAARPPRPHGGPRQLRVPAGARLHRS